MRIIISPAKKMNVDTDSLPYESLPQFLQQTEILLGCLRTMDAAALKALWRCNDSITELNYGRVQSMNLHHALTPAILSYEGIQYQYMAPGVLEREQLQYMGEHLRILSGFYGLLRPFDGVTPYRLEMQARLSAAGQNNLYGFWADRLARQLCAETDLILNLASKEYSKAISPHLPASVRFLTCTFGEWNDGKIVQKGTMCKMARGEMVRWLAEQNVTSPGDIRAFDRLGYTYRKELSEQDHYVFLKENRKKQNIRVFQNDF